MRKVVAAAKKTKKKQRSKPAVDRKPGFMKGQIEIKRSFFDPLPEEILKAFRGESE